MFTDDPAMSRVGGDIESLREMEPETSRVQVAARADYAVLGQARYLLRHVRQDVHCNKKKGSRFHCKGHYTSQHKNC